MDLLSWSTIRSGTFRFVIYLFIGKISWNSVCKIILNIGLVMEMYALKTFRLIVKESSSTISRLLYLYNTWILIGKDGFDDFWPYFAVILLFTTKNIIIKDTHTFTLGIIYYICTIIKSKGSNATLHVYEIIIYCSFVLFILENNINCK